MCTHFFECVRICMCVCIPGVCVRVCARACMHAFVRACVRACVCYLCEGPGELQVLVGGVTALQQPGPAVDVHQTLVVVVVDGGAEHPEVQLLGAGVVHVLGREETNVSTEQTCHASSSNSREVTRSPGFYL